MFTNTSIRDFVCLFFLAVYFLPPQERGGGGDASGDYNSISEDKAWDSRVGLYICMESPFLGSLIITTNTV